MRILSLFIFVGIACIALLYFLQPNTSQPTLLEDTNSTSTQTAISGTGVYFKNVEVETFAPGNPRIAGTGQISTFQGLAVTVDGVERMVPSEHPASEYPMLLVMDFSVSPSNKYVSITTRKYADEAEISFLVYDISTNTLHEIEYPLITGDDEYLYPEEVSNIRWSEDNKLHAELPLIETSIVSVSSAEPWIMQTDI